MNGGGADQFIEQVREKLGERARMEPDKPQSRQVFGLEIKEILKGHGAGARTKRGW